MAHRQQMEYCRSVQERHKEYFSNKRVLEVGSLDVNGSLRIFFKDCDYTGIDVHDGRGVDVVCKGHEYEAEPFDVVCSAECFEHDEYYDQTIKNMIRLLKPGGLFFFTCATTGRAEHGTRRSNQALWGTSPDYYKNLTEEDFRAFLPVEKVFDDFEFKIENRTKDIYFKGIKK